MVCHHWWSVTSLLPHGLSCLLSATGAFLQHALDNHIFVVSVLAAAVSHNEVLIQSAKKEGGKAQCLLANQLKILCCLGDADVFDTNSDGVSDSFDDNDDGKADTFDNDRDGELDSVDYDEVEIRIGLMAPCNGYRYRRMGKSPVRMMYV